MLWGVEGAVLLWGDKRPTWDGYMKGWGGDRFLDKKGRYLGRGDVRVQCKRTRHGTCDRFGERGGKGTMMKRLCVRDLKYQEGNGATLGGVKEQGLGNSNVCVGPLNSGVESGGE